MLSPFTAPSSQQPLPWNPEAGPFPSFQGNQQSMSHAPVSCAGVVVDISGTSNRGCLRAKNDQVPAAINLVMSRYGGLAHVKLHSIVGSVYEVVTGALRRASSIFSVSRQRKSVL